MQEGGATTCFPVLAWRPLVVATGCLAGLAVNPGQARQLVATRQCDVLRAERGAVADLAASLGVPRVGTNQCPRGMTVWSLKSKKLQLVLSHAASRGILFTSG